MFFSLREGLKNLGHHKILAFSTFVTMFTTLFLIAFFSIAVIDIADIFNSFEVKESSIVVVLSEDSDGESVKRIESSIRDLPGVSSLAFVDRSEAFGEYAEGLVDGDLMNKLEADNPLPNIFIVGMESFQDADEVYGKLQVIPGIDELIYDKDYLNKAATVIAEFKNVLYFLIILLTVSTIILVYTVIHLTVKSRESDVRVMMLMGAPGRYMRGPFIVQGMLIGVIGAGAASFAIFKVYDLLVGPIGQLFPFIQSSMLYDEKKLSVVVLIMLIGVGLGVIGGGMSSGDIMRKVKLERS